MGRPRLHIEAPTAQRSPPVGEGLGRWALSVLQVDIGVGHFHGFVTLAIHPCAEHHMPPSPTHATTPTLAHEMNTISPDTRRKANGFGMLGLFGLVGLGAGNRNTQSASAMHVGRSGPELVRTRIQARHVTTQQQDARRLGDSGGRRGLQPDAPGLQPDAPGLQPDAPSKEGSVQNPGVPPLSKLRKGPKSIRSLRLHPQIHQKHRFRHRKCRSLDKAVVCAYHIQPPTHTCRGSKGQYKGECLPGARPARYF